MEYTDDADDVPQTPCWEAIAIAEPEIIFIFCLN